MNKTAIKNFAIWARNELIDKVSHRASLYEIYKEEGRTKKEIDVTQNNKILSPEEKKSRKALINKIEEGYEEVIEEVAYTWFNRFISIRFMEVNDYLPSGIRMFSSINNEFRPEILEEAINLEDPWFNKDKVLNLYREGNKEEELFKYLFISKCNELNKILPGMFQKINDYTELLLPDNLLVSGSVLDRMIKDIPEEDWREQVQIIGWLYQYYNIEPKDLIYSRPKTEKIKKDEMPAATQLFTPDWIVRYMVENSLGRLWLEGHPNEELKSKWKYYLEEAEQESKAQEELEEIKEKSKKINPEDIKCIDPCIGSGHIGTYLFDVLIQIYESHGYKRRDAVKLIIEKNIYGIEIDERARQLSYFSIMMKGLEYDRRFLERNTIPQPNIYLIIESNFFKSQDGLRAIEYFANEDKELKKNIESLVDDMIDAREYGSILKITKVDFDKIESRFIEIESSQIEGYGKLCLEELEPLVVQAKLLSQKYDVVVTNPPYMGSSRMNGKLSNYLKNNYKDSKSDLFAVFIEKCNDMTKVNGFNSMVTMQSWMFLSSYENLRRKIFIENTIYNLLHMENMVMGIAFGTSATVFRKIFMENYIGNYNEIKFSDIVDDKPITFPIKVNRNSMTSLAKFEKIPGSPIAYWASDSIINVFENSKNLEELSDPKQGLATTENKRFLRLWNEVNFNEIGIGFENSESFNDNKKRWAPYNKGGNYRKWYGNIEYIVKWENDGEEIKSVVKEKYKDRPYAKGFTKERWDKLIEVWVVKNINYYFKESVSWTFISSGDLSVRYYPSGFIFDVSGSSLFVDYPQNLYLLSFLTTTIANKILKLLNPTINLQVGDIKNIPIIESKKHEEKIIRIAKSNINLSKSDWDMHEASWDFKVSPLLANLRDGKIESAYEAYKREVNERFGKLKVNEEELNRIFIDIYGLQDELTPEVSDRDITIAKIFDKKEEIDEIIKGNKYVMTREDVVKNFLSYFIGCLMGRYSLDEEDLVYAGGDFDTSRYKSFIPDSDGIAIFTDDEYFDEDIVTRLQDFLIKIFGPDDLEENLEFIAAELKGKASDSPREKIRKYFLNDFFKDHLKMYQKKPIYWQYDSGKNASVRGIFYLHRYDKDTFARIRINYIFEMQNRYKQELERLNDQLKSANKSEQIQIQKKMNELKKKLAESEKFEEKIQHIADSYIEIDLDDGVDENYKIFKDVLSKIK
ncbi:BREX-1 system adenine-specific DNA-methyltransferase PglX [Peptoniphilus vaginalis]|uniref:BREX-1 system adenine-specific DNA-methyltransferase PglX n=1 Tax=Peptoniphilus vaginalis TaxID=1756987 RepID=UPI0023F774A5|nr:BREX-1 system adenine-specific DNA-methyltransferase PglX [Peptoniphilus vaginalis]